MASSTEYVIFIGNFAPIIYLVISINRDEQLCDGWIHYILNPISCLIFAFLCTKKIMALIMTGWVAIEYFYILPQQMKYINI